MSNVVVRAAVENYISVSNRCISRALAGGKVDRAALARAAAALRECAAAKPRQRQPKPVSFSVSYADGAAFAVQGWDALALRLGVQAATARTRMSAARNRLVVSLLHPKTGELATAIITRDLA